MIDETFCGRQLNIGIGSRYPLSTDTNFTSDNHLVMSLEIISQDGKTVALMGTSTGHFLKVTLFNE